MDHDHSYKLLFSHQPMMADLLRGFVAQDWAHLLDLTTLERVMTSQVSEDLQEREDDILWRVRWPEGWVYLYVLVEFQSIPWLQAPEHEGLRRAFTACLNRVFLLARLPTVPIPEVQGLVEVQSMLAERVTEWTQQWKEEGRQEGLAAERVLLVRQARSRFGEACAEALVPLLEPCTDTSVLADIGEWIVTVNSGEALIERVQQHQRSGAENSLT